MKRARIIRRSDLEQPGSGRAAFQLEASDQGFQDAVFRSAADARAIALAEGYEVDAHVFER